MVETPLFRVGTARAHLLAAMQGSAEYRAEHLQQADEALSEAQQVIAAWANYQYRRAR